MDYEGSSVTGAQFTFAIGSGQKKAPSRVTGTAFLFTLRQVGGAADRSA
jgi:hypothetical protein